MDKLEKIKDIFKGLDLSEVKYRDKDFEIVLKKHIKYADKNINEKALEIKDEDSSTYSELPKKNYYKVKSPLVGLFYSKPAPDEEPFTNTGQKVQKGDVLCVIESMKMFNEIKSPVSGYVREIKFKDQDIVAVDDIIIEIEEDNV